MPMVNGLELSKAQEVVRSAIADPRFTIQHSHTGTAPWTHGHGSQRGYPASPSSRKTRSLVGGWVENRRVKPSQLKGFTIIR